MWFGFDCAHAGDKTRMMDNFEISDVAEGGHFWTQEEVVEETEKLAEQLKEMTWEDIVEAKLEYMPDWFKTRIEINSTNGEGGEAEDN